MPEQALPGRDWEQFIGGNVINKIGIVALLIGLGVLLLFASYLYQKFRDAL